MAIRENVVFAVDMLVQQQETAGMSSIVTILCHHRSMDPRLTRLNRSSLARADATSDGDGHTTATPKRKQTCPPWYGPIAGSRWDG